MMIADSRDKKSEQLTPEGPHKNGTAEKYQQRIDEQLPVVIFDHDAQAGEMKEERAAHDAQPQHRPDSGSPGDQQEDRGYELDDAGTNAAPGFHTQFRKNVHRFLRGAEFEEERLQQDDGRQDPEDPKKLNSVFAEHNGRIYPGMVLSIEFFPIGIRLLFEIGFVLVPGF